MNKSLRFLAIGLALAVLLVSQVGVDRSAEAVTVKLTDGNVKFTADPVADDADSVAQLAALEEKDFYRPGVSANPVFANFFLRGDDLALDTANRVTTVTWTVPEGTLMDPTFTLGSRPAGTNGENDTAPSIEGTPSMPHDPDFGAGRTTKFDTVTTYTTSGPWAMYRGDTTTPLDGDPLVIVANAGSGQTISVDENGKRLLRRSNADTGSFSILDDVTPRVPEADGDSGTTTIVAKFKYHVSDVFAEDQDKGAGAGPDQNRAKVTSSSDSVGAWVTITEVKGVGSTSTAPTSNIYHGSVRLTGDSRDASNDKNAVWVRDGDTLTVTFYEDDHVTEIGSDTAIIDAEDPSISGVSPSDGTVTDDNSPVVTFMVTDDGAGFDTSNPRGHVDVFVVADDNRSCRINDDQLTATRLSSSEVEILFRNTAGSWAAGGPGLTCDNTQGDVSGVNTLHVDTTSIGDNNHGKEFMIKVVAVDRAGNMKETPVKVTIDTGNPALDAASTGKSWDGKKVTDDRAGIMLTFTESLQADSVDASDFTVENPDVTVEDVIVGGLNGDSKTSDEDKLLNELVFLVLSEDLPSDARPRIELDGSIMDTAGNELKKTAITRSEDGISPDVTVDALAASLLAEDGESAVTFSADENMAAIASQLANGCTCLGITGGEGMAVSKGPVALPTPSTATYTFKQGKRDTGIYGIMVQASDSRANLTQVGEEKASNEKVTVAAPEEGEGLVVSLKNWPLTAVEAGQIASDLTNAVKVSLTSGGDPVTTSTVMSVNWVEGTVTMNLGTEVKATDTVYASYSYVSGDQTIEVDTDAPMVSFEPDEDTQNARPFIRIHFDDDEYGGDTHTTVTVTEATLSDADGNEWVLVDEDVDLLSTSDWESYSYLPDSDLALGEYTITVVGRDQAGNSTGEKSGKFKLTERPPVSIPLSLGWNLISLPADPADSAIDTVINVAEVTQVLTYDPTVEGGWLAAVRVNGAFEGGLTNIDATKAYLVYTTSVDPAEG